MKVWAFNKVTGDDARKLVYDSIKNGKSRFGWSCDDKSNLKLEDNWSKNHPRQKFLLKIKKGDWIVHINTPEWGKCIAGQVISEYDFDEGLQGDWGSDFRHNFSLDPKTIIEFDRKDHNVSPCVNLFPRRRGQRVKEADDFIQSIERLKNKTISSSNDVDRGELYLKQKTEECLKEIALHIHKTHSGKKLESFLARVMRKIPGVEEVDENGSGWRTDHGADLIITIRSGIGAIDFFTHTVIVQVKSFEGKHYDLGQ